MLVKRKIENGKCVGAIVKHIGPRQNLTDRFIKKSIGEGWMSWDGSMIKIHSDPPVRLKAIRVPGYYVVFDSLRRFQTMDEAQNYKNETWPGRESTDPQVPSGIQLLTCYEFETVGHEQTINPKKDFVDKFLDFLVGD